MVSTSTWGSEETKYFYEITPECILEAVESSGVRCTGRQLALNSVENRVYEVEVELDGEPELPSDRFRIIKFYRPGRWSKEQISEEHSFLQQLEQEGICVVAPVEFNGSTIHRAGTSAVWFSIFPKLQARGMAEITDQHLERVGKLLARIHILASAQDFQHRPTLDPATYGTANLQYLKENDLIPANIKDPYCNLVEQICEITAPWFQETKMQRVHGDAHRGNLLERYEDLYFVDFDDCVTGPAVQDIWMLSRGSDQQESREKMDILLNAYEELRDFDRTSLRLIEPLRALRYVHHTAWIAKRWSDPAFPHVFPNFGSEQYWRDQLGDLQEQLEIIHGRDALL